MKAATLEEEEKLKFELGLVEPFMTGGLKAGASTAGLNVETPGANAGALGVNTGALGVNAGAAILKALLGPSILDLLLQGVESWLAGPGLLPAKENEDEKPEGLKEADGLNVNSLASTLSLEIEDFEVCLLCILDPGFPVANLESFHELA